MISLTCKAAIRAVVYLASRHETNTNSGIKEVAENIEASEHTVGKILQLLVKENVINSIKGPSGGFYITKSQMNLPVLDIVSAIDGKEIFESCGLGLSKCSATHPCPVHNEYKSIRNHLYNLFEKNTISDICRNVKKGLAHLA